MSAAEGRNRRRYHYVLFRCQTERFLNEARSVRAHGLLPLCTIIHCAQSISSLLNLASASLKAEFQFQEGKRGAVLVMHKPQQEYIPRGKVLTLVHKAVELQDKYLVTSTFTCPGYYIYLSNKCASTYFVLHQRNYADGLTQPERG